MCPSDPIIETPCINKCKLDKDNKYCISCKRSVEQLVKWIQYTDEERKHIIESLR